MGGDPWEPAPRRGVSEPVVHRKDRNRSRAQATRAGDEAEARPRPEAGNPPPSGSVGTAPRTNQWDFSRPESTEGMSNSSKSARGVLFLGGALLVVLVVQYLLGLWTSVYAPAQFASFDSGAGYSPSLRAHILAGDVLFLGSVVVLVLAAISRRPRLIAPALVLAASIFLAGQFGMAFVNSSPNDPIDSFGMGATFLVALTSATALVVLSWGRRGGAPGPGGPVASPQTESG